MVEAWAEKFVVIGPDPATLASSVADRFLDRVIKRTSAGKHAHVSLTGGSMGSAVLRAAASKPAVQEIDWALVHFWWSDERFVVRGHADRNDQQAHDALLGTLDIPTDNIHSMAASDDGIDLDQAAEAYASELARFGAGDRAWPSFDVCFLGVGPDGHIASLFPDRSDIHVTDRAVVAVRNSPKPPPERVTMTRPVINDSKRVWMVLTGADKASALGLALAGASYSNVPAAGAKGRKRTVFFVDEAAAEKVPYELIDREY
ncbi:6-phosphogluconolactonase [Microbacterium sp. C7(2022)]|uniref:6-phosphogluconolactonase n=1 Tax=Microbacterium sp. C7(2022) TaxID=2992759 RepID=UPI00237B9834|nr:6-phosphogluconolactonase [Microbacterium sp. C7(2022)]MDE0546809.1 6-phosphogluconolactonase [Microbacterium sp. C7(2022)]